MGADPIIITPKNGRYAGRDCWYFPHSKRVLPIVRGGDGSGDAGTGAGDGAGGASASGSGEGSGTSGSGDGGGQQTAKSFTQDDLNRVSTEQKREGERHARRQLLEQLGLDPNDSSIDVSKIAETLKTAHEAEEQQKTELQRQTDAAAKSKADSDKATADAKRETLKAKVTLGVVSAGAPAANAGDVSTLVRAELDGKEDPSDDEVTAAVEAVKKRQASLFEATQQTNGNGNKQTPTAPSGVPQGTQKPQAGDDSLTKAQDRAAVKHGGKPIAAAS